MFHPESAPPPSIDPGLPPPTSTSSFWHNPPHSFLHSHRTTPTLPESVRTIIIGSGMAGSMLYTQLHTLSLSNSVLMLEARNTCFGATGRNGGHCKPMLYKMGITTLEEYASIFGLPEALKRIRFELLNLALVKEYVDAEAVDCEFVELQSADVYYEKPLLEVAKRNIAALGKAAPELAKALRVVTAETAEGRSELKEVLRTPTAAGAVVSNAGKLWPYKLVGHILAKGVREQGLNLQTTTPAMSVTRHGKDKWAVETPRGVVVADRVVFATNAYTAHLLPAFKGWIYPVRAQMSALLPPKSLRDRPLTHTYGLIRDDMMKLDYLIQRPIARDGTGGELMLGGGRHLEAEHGIGLNDGSINADVSAHLRGGIPGYFADEKGYEDDEDLRKSFIAEFRRLRVSAKKGHDVWDAAEGLGFGPESESDDEFEVRERMKRGPQCKAVAEWSGTMGFSRDECPFVGKVPAVTAEDAVAKEIPLLEDTKGLWMLAGFEGHGKQLPSTITAHTDECTGMAFTTGSAKALALMIYAEQHGLDIEDDCGLYDWFPRTFESTPARIGLREGPEKDTEWVLVENQ